VSLLKNHHNNTLYTQRIEGIVIDVLLLCCNALYENRLARRVVHLCRSWSKRRTVVQHAHLHRGYKNMIIPCGAPLQLCRFFSRHNKYLTTPHSLAGDDCYPPWELRGYLYLYIYTCIIYTHIYDVIRTVSRLIVVTYLRRILYSGANYGCISLVVRGEGGGQLMTSTRPFLRYL